MVRPMSIIDLVVLIPFYLEILLEHQYVANQRSDEGTQAKGLCLCMVAA